MIALFIQPTNHLLVAGNRTRQGDTRVANQSHSATKCAWLSHEGHSDTIRQTSAPFKCHIYTSMQRFERPQRRIACHIRFACPCIPYSGTKLLSELVVASATQRTHAAARQANGSCRSTVIPAMAKKRWHTLCSFAGMDSLLCKQVRRLETL